MCKPNDPCLECLECDRLNKTCKGREIYYPEDCPASDSYLVPRTGE